MVFFLWRRGCREETMKSTFLMLLVSRMFAGFLVVGSLSALGNFSLNGWTGVIVHWLSCLGVLTAVIL